MVSEYSDRQRDQWLLFPAWLQMEGQCPSDHHFWALLHAWVAFQAQRLPHKPQSSNLIVPICVYVVTSIKEQQTRLKLRKSVSYANPALIENALVVLPVLGGRT